MLPPPTFAERPDVILTLYVVYKDTLDYPGEFVVRRWFVERGKAEPQAEPTLFHRGPTLEAAREQLPQHLYRIPHQPGEDPVIVETWL